MALAEFWKRYAERRAEFRKLHPKKIESPFQIHYLERYLLIGDQLRVTLNDAAWLFYATECDVSVVAIHEYDDGSLCIRAIDGKLWPLKREHT